MLRDAGYHIPPWLIDDIRQERRPTTVVGRDMNEQEQRTIYEWLTHTKVERQMCGWYGLYMSTYGGQAWVQCPPLDMNTWHTEVVPKLIAEGCEYVNTEYHIDSGYSCCILGPAGEPNIEGAAQDEWAIDIAYAALLAYIKGVRE